MATVLASVSSTAFHASALAKWLHSSAHRNFNLDTTTTIFTPTDRSYNEALLVLAIFIGSFGVLLFILLLLSYCCWFCTCKKKIERLSSKTYYSRKSCFECFIVIVSVICSAAIIVGYIYNGQTSDGVDDFGNAIKKIQSNLNSASSEGRKLEAILGNTTGLIKELAVNPNLPDVMIAKRLAYLMQTGIENLNDMLPVHVGNSGNSFSKNMHRYDNYRWLITVCVFTWCFLLCGFSLWICCRTNCCVMTMLTILLFSSLLLTWILLGANFGLAVGAGDFCVNPDTAIKNLTSNKPVESAVIDYYLNCAKLNPFEVNVHGFEGNISYVIRIIQNIHDEYPQYQTITEKILQDLQEIKSQFAVYQDSYACAKIHGEYMNAMDGLCNEALVGLAVVMLALFIVAFFSGLMTCCVCPLWGYRKSYHHAFPNVGANTGDDGVLWWPEDIGHPVNNDEQPPQDYAYNERSPLIDVQPRSSYAPVNDRVGVPQGAKHQGTNEAPF